MISVCSRSVREITQSQHAQIFHSLVRVRGSHKQSATLRKSFSDSQSKLYAKTLHSQTDKNDTK